MLSQNQTRMTQNCSVAYFKQYRNIKKMYQLCCMWVMFAGSPSYVTSNFRFLCSKETTAFANSAILSDQTQKRSGYLTLVFTKSTLAHFLLFHVRLKQSTENAQKKRRK